MPRTELSHGVVPYHESGDDLTAAGLGRLVADFLDALDLHDVSLVGNDSGAAVARPGV